VEGNILSFSEVNGTTLANKPYILVPAADGKLLSDMSATLLPQTPASLSL